MTKDSVHLSPAHLDFINDALKSKSAEEILQWALITFPGLFQTTAFGLTGIVILDMISKLDPSSSHPIDLIFLDTLHHFQETLDLVDRVRSKYNPTIHVFKPQDANSESEFARQFGENLWDSNDTLYDYLVKVEPAHRAYEALGVQAVITGRRQSQGGARARLAPVEYDPATSLIKINPLYNWSFDRVKAYVAENNLPYNSLLDKGYRSVGDYHSTLPVAEGEDERAGRWKGKAKTECGIHEASRFAQFLKAGSVAEAS